MRKVITPSLRFQVLNRDNFECQYCGLKAGNGVQLQVDHKISVKNGGDNSLNNLITSCFECNIGKGKKDIQEVKEKLYETKISENIKNHIGLFYRFWNYKELGTIDNNTKALLNIYFGNYLGGNKYEEIINEYFYFKYCYKEISKKEYDDIDINKYINVFKKGGPFCDIILNSMEGPFSGVLKFDDKVNFNTMIDCCDDLFEDDDWNENGTCYNNYNNRLNYILTKYLFSEYEEGCLKNDYSIKKFSYFYNEIRNG